jgi:hypothetical protein
VEGPLNNLQTSQMSLPRPKVSNHDKRLNFTALGGQGLDEGSFPSMNQDRDRERGGDGGYDSVQQNYYQRGWGDHPDLRSHDGHSQSSNHGDGRGGDKRSGDRTDSRYDSRYADREHERDDDQDDRSRDDLSHNRNSQSVNQYGGGGSGQGPAYGGSFFGGGITGYSDPYLAQSSSQSRRDDRDGTDDMSLASQDGSNSISTYGLA